MVRERWTQSGMANDFVKKYLGVSRILMWTIGKEVSKSTYAQGVGRHTDKEVDQITVGNLTALSNFIGQLHCNFIKIMSRINVV